MSDLSQEELASAPPPKVCAVCGRVLDHQEGAGHFHPRAEEQDHLAVPVDPGEMPARPRCDFCDADLVPGQIWTLPARSFQYGDAPGVSVGNWAMCPSCSELASTKAWPQLVLRVYGVLRRRGTSVTPEFIAGWIQRVIDNQTGAPFLGEGW